MVEEKVVLRNGIKIIGSSPYFYSKNHGLKVWPLSDDVTMIKSEKFPSLWTSLSYLTKKFNIVLFDWFKTLKNPEEKRG